MGLNTWWWCGDYTKRWQWGWWRSNTKGSGTIIESPSFQTILKTTRAHKIIIIRRLVWVTANGPVNDTSVKLQTEMVVCGCVQTCQWEIPFVFDTNYVTAKSSLNNYNDDLMIFMANYFIIFETEGENVQLLVIYQLHPQ